MLTESEIIDHFSSRNLNEESGTYLRTHARRFAYLYNMVDKMRRNYGDNPIRIMDIGPSWSCLRGVILTR